MYTSAKITLHEPHADLKLNELDSEANDFTCKSAHKVGEALDDAYHLLRTMADSVSDITLADPYCVVSRSSVGGHVCPCPFVAISQ